MKVLAVTSEPISAERLHGALDGVPIADVEEVDPEELGRELGVPVERHLVAPAADA